MSDPAAHNTGPVPSPLPKHVYKIIPEAPPSPLPAEWPLSDLDRNDGFIHLSTAKQVKPKSPPPFALSWRSLNGISNKIPITAGLFFAHTTKLWVLKLPFGPLESHVRWEVPDTDGCPHLHGRNFGAADVLDAKGFERSEGQTWGDAMDDGSGWLEH